MINGTLAVVVFRRIGPDVTSAVAGSFAAGGVVAAEDGIGGTVVVLLIAASPAVEASLGAAGPAYASWPRRARRRNSA